MLASKIVLLLVQNEERVCETRSGPILITSWSCEKRYQVLPTYTCSHSKKPKTNKANVYIVCIVIRFFFRLVKFRQKNIRVK